jgi:hypothetical protein
VNQSAPSGPAVMAAGPPLDSGAGNSVRTPAGVSFPIWPEPNSMN